MTVPDSRRAALRYAYKLLGYRGRSEAEIVKKLTMKGFEGRDIEGVVVRLKEQGFLDDRKLAESLTRYAGESKLLSVAGTKRLLAERGVPREIAEEALKQIDETAVARRLVERKIASWRKRGSPRDSEADALAFKKLYGLLYRRGYPSEAIKEILRQFRDEEDE
ncbi:MAG: recombination regulator RecX [Nitrospirae bacterium]|nr:recombination regulator RecX [Nitrospirota bacterium]